MGIFEVEKMFVREEGVEEGIKKGIDLGDRKRQLKDAGNFLRLGVDVAIVKKATGLSWDEIKSLQQQD